MPSMCKASGCLVSLAPSAISVVVTGMPYSDARRRMDLAALALITPPPA